MSSRTRPTVRVTTRFNQIEMTQPLDYSQPQKRARRKLNGAIIFTISAALVAAVGMLYLLQTNHIANLGFEMSRFQQEQASQVTQNQKLTSEIATYQSISDIERMAVSELGMEPATSMQFLTVQQPQTAEITIPEAEPQPERSFLSKLWDRISGTGRTGDLEAGQ